MKSIIAITAAVLTLSAPAIADVSNAEAFFALGNDSAAERIVGETSVGNPTGAERAFAAYNDSPAEQSVLNDENAVTRGAILSAQSLFALSNDSAAERFVNK